MSSTHLHFFVFPLFWCTQSEGGCKTTPAPTDAQPSFWDCWKWVRSRIGESRLGLENKNLTQTEKTWTRLSFPFFASSQPARLISDSSSGVGLCCFFLAYCFRLEQWDKKTMRVTMLAHWRVFQELPWCGTLGRNCWVDDLLATHSTHLGTVSSSPRDQKKVSNISNSGASRNGPQQQWLSQFNQVARTQVAYKIKIQRSLPSRGPRRWNWWTATLWWSFSKKWNDQIFGWEVGNIVSKRAWAGTRISIALWVTM